MVKPSLKRISSRRAGPTPIMMAPSTAPQVGRIQNGAAFEGLDHLDQPRRAGLRSTSTSQQAATTEFFGAAGQADTCAGAALLAAVHPAEPFGGGVQHVPHPLVVEVREPELQRIFARRFGQFVGECLPREVVRRGCQAAPDLQVGLSDIDLHGPSVRPCQAKRRRVRGTNERGLVPVRYNDNLKVMSIEFVVPYQADEAVIGVGP